MLYNFVTKEPTLKLNMPRGIRRRMIIILCPALKQSTGGNWFKHDCEVQAAVKPWQMTDDTDWYHQATEDKGEGKGFP
jgi:hypothetical protein